MDLPADGLELATRTIVVSLLVGTLATVLAAAIPARRATKIAPVAALRDSAARRSRPRLFARGVRGVAGVVGRPSAALGGAAGRLARRNAMRNPGRTAVTALALMIGVALVTAVTIVAQGLENQSSRRARPARAGDQRSSPPSDGWSPIDPKVEQAVAGGRHAAAAPGRRARVRPPGGRQRRRSRRRSATSPLRLHRRRRSTSARRRARRRGLRHRARPAASAARFADHLDARQDAAT